MSYIQIDKKAVMEEDAQALLDQTYALHDPLGTPTLFIRPEDFPMQSEMLSSISFMAAKSLGLEFAARAVMKNKVLEKLKSVKSFWYFDLCPKVPDFIPEVADLILKEHLSPDDVPDYIAYDFSIPLSSHGADKHDPQTYKQPHFSMVFLSSQARMLGNMFAFSGIDSEINVGASSQMPFMTLWHEIAHGAGASEPQAEMIMATVTRQAFEDNTMISVFSDLRAYGAVLQEGSGKEVYGWPMVEVNDYVMNLPEGVIDVMGEQEIKDIRFQKFDHLVGTVTEVSDLLKDRASTEFDTRSLLGLAKAAQELREDMGVSLTDNQRQILTRFELATRRLHHGEEAYQDGNILISDELLQSERTAPITFTPSEWIPSAE